MPSYSRIRQLVLGARLRATGVLLRVPFFRKRLLRPRSGGCILGYHNVVPGGDTRFNSKTISTRTFEDHLRYFSDHFEVVPVREFFQRKKTPSSRFTIALTFDDGLANNVHRALPLLEKYQMPASFYITSIPEAGYEILWPDFIDICTPDAPDSVVIQGELFRKNRKQEFKSASSGKSLKNVCRQSPDFSFKLAAMEALGGMEAIQKHSGYAEYWRVMIPEEIRLLAASALAEVGSHGHWHNCLGAIAYPDAVHELQVSKSWIETITGKPCTELAWPDGSYTRALIEEAARLGYQYQLASEYLFEEDVSDGRILDRFGINPYIGQDVQMYSVLRGRY